jgi:hypothetical protein
MSDAQKPATVTLVVMTLNEIEGMRAVMPRVARDGLDQILVVDGGSTDGTVEWARANGFEVHVQRRHGIRHAYFEAWPLIRGDYVVTFSPDGNSLPEAIPALIDALRTGNDLVIASRYLPGAGSTDDDLITAFGNRLFTRTLNLLYGARYTDVMVMLRGYRKSIVEDLGLLNDRAYELPERLFGTVISWEPLMSVRAAKAGLRIAEIPAAEPPRIGGSRKLQIWRWGAAYYLQFWLERVFWLGGVPVAARAAAPAVSGSRHPCSQRTTAGRFIGDGAPDWPLRLAFVLVAAVLFALVRSMTGLVWNDSASLSVTLNSPPGAGALDPAGVLHVLRSGFASAIGGGYRPLSQIVADIGVRYFAAGGSIFPWALPVGVLIGVFMQVLYFTARRFGAAPPFAALAVFLVVFSSPFVASSWVIAAGIQVLVPLFICAGVLVYWKLADTGYRSVPLHVLLAGLFIAGPWFREFIGVAPLLVGLLDLMRRRRPTAVLLIAAGGFVHALYPGWLVHVFVPSAPTIPVHRMGLLGARMAEISGSPGQQFLYGLRLGAQVSVQFLLLLPSTIIVLVAAAAAWTRFANGRSAARGAGVVNGDPIVGAGGPRDVLFLSLWTAASLLPLFRVYTSEVHLLYALVPFALLAGLAIQYLWRATAGSGPRVAAARAVVGVALLIGIADQALNYPNSVRVVTAMNDGMVQVAERIRGSVPRGAVIVGNGLHLEDLHLLSGGHFVPYWTVERGIPYPPAERALLSRERLAALFRAHLHPVYLLDMDYDLVPGIRRYIAHRFVDRPGVETERLWTVEAIRVRYPFLDPLKLVLPRQFTTVLFAPDLVNDVYRGRARGGTPFLREVYVTHTLYRVIGVRP